jgi:hypothetical protein
MKTAILLVLAVALGCQTQVWTRPGGTDEQLEQDWRDCYGRSVMPMLIGTGIMIVPYRPIERCLEEKGWRKRG